MDKLDMNLTLEPVLANICQQLANFFGTTTDVVIEHAPEFLAKYGWFSVLSNLRDDIFFGGLISLLLSGLVFLGISLINDEIYYGENAKKLSPIKWATIFYIIAMIFNIGSSILPCIIAPEFVGLKYLLRLFEIYI